MFLNVEPSSPVPIYRQLVDQIRRAVASGRLAPGERLPGSREMADDLQINLHTVNKAYRELVREGVLEQKRGVGTFVAEEPNTRTSDEALEALKEKLKDVCEEAQAYDVSKEQMEQLLNELWNDKFDER